MKAIIGMVLIAGLAYGQESDIAALRAQGEAQAAALSAAIARLDALGVPDVSPGVPVVAPAGTGADPLTAYREANPAPEKGHLDPARLYLRRVGPDVIVAADLFQGGPGEILRNTGKYIVQSPASFLTSAAVAYVAIRGVSGKLDDDFDKLRGKSKSKSSAGSVNTQPGGTTVIVQGNGDVTVVQGDGNTTGRGTSRDTTTTTTTTNPGFAPPPVVEPEPIPEPAPEV